MKITGIDTFAVDGGARPWHFVAIRTDEGVTGYGEFGESGVTHGIQGLVRDMSTWLIGKDPGPVERLYFDLYRAYRGTPYGVTAWAIAGIELALWDLKGKALGLPVHRVVGGPFREKQRVYWSHLGTYRARNHELWGAKPLRTWDDVADCAREAVDKGYTAFKTNILFPGDPSSAITQGRDGISHDGLAEADLVNQAVKQISVMRDAVGPEIDICLDINYNFKTEGAIRVARALEPYKLYWLEIDNQDPEALLQLKTSTRTSITSGEQLVTMRQYQPFFELRAMDTVKVDVQWQGFGNAKKVADLAETFELNIAPHNYNSHLSTFQSLNLCASVSNVRIMESDPDAIPWKDDLVTVVPVPTNSYIDIPQGPGWGTELNEEVAKRHAWNK
jgi:L-alanine-DL-glutamate epimerase-like enolase superfamily enzyme